MYDFKEAKKNLTRKIEFISMKIKKINGKSCVIIMVNANIKIRNKFFINKSFVIAALFSMM